MQSEELAWLEYYKKAGISWLAPMTVELIKLAYFAGMKAAQQPLAPDVAESPQKCTTEKLCPVHNVWHVAPPRR